MMSKIRSFNLILFLFFYSCGTNINSDYSIIISKKSQFSKNGDKISLKIKNPSDKKIEKLEFKINNIPIKDEYVLNNNLGVNLIQASFTINEKVINLNKDLTIFSNTIPKLYTYKIINEYSRIRI